MSYFVHWINWNSKWDEWIDEDFRISKGSQDYQYCMQLLKEKNRNRVKENIHSSLINDINSDESIEEDMTEYQLKNVQLLPLPQQISLSLYQQYKLIEAKPILLILLPKSQELNINGIIDKFIKYQSIKIERDNKLNPFEEKIYLKQVMDGIKYYFNQLIDINLLYKNEQKQKLKLIKNYNTNNNDNDKIDYCDIFGIEHLFRLIYHLPKLYGNIKTFSHPLQRAKISEFTTYLISYLVDNIQQFHVQFNIDRNTSNKGLILCDIGK